MLNQRTIKNPIKAVGVGLHSGRDMTLELLPAPIDAGITFIRTDLDPEICIPAKFEYVGDTTLSTALFKEGYKIGTIEHLLSAIAGLGIDNCIIKVDGPEIPIMDGSASPFVFLIQSAGLEVQDKLKNLLKLRKKSGSNVGIHTRPSNLLMVSRSHLKLILTIQPFKNMLKNHLLIFLLHHLLKKCVGPGLLDQ